MRIPRTFAAPALLILSVVAPADAQTWEDITPASGPSPRWVPSAVFDAQERRMVVFGGEATGGTRLRDVWAFDLDTHTWADLTPASGSVPAPRKTPMSVYDPAGHRMITWSGLGPGNTFYNDAWAFDLTTNTWTALSPSGGPPAIRYGAAGVYDPATGDLVTFAGFTFQGRFEDVWRLDATAETWTDVSAPAASSPLKRCLHSASYDAYNHRLIMYGGQNGGALNDIWAFDLDTQTWTDLTPSVFPVGRWFPAHVYDAANHRSTIFGGDTGAGKSNEVWLFDLWTDEFTLMMPAGTPPSERDGAVAVYDGALDRMVVFGGKDTDVSSEVWALNDLSDTPTSASATPARATLHQNVPNPFNPTTTIDFELAARGHATLRVFNARGQLVHTLVDEVRDAGPHTVVWDGRDAGGTRVSSGVYFCQLDGDGVRASRKMVLLK